MRPLLLAMGLVAQTIPCGGAPNFCPGFAVSNMALAVNGATAQASSTYGDGSQYSAASAITGNRVSRGFGSQGGWLTSPWQASPDWLEVDFPIATSIREIDIVGLPDDYASSTPASLTPTLPFTLYGLVNFDVQYSTGSGWTDVPGGAVTNNTLVWRTFTFPALSMSSLRVLVARTGNYTAIVDVEAWK